MEKIIQQVQENKENYEFEDEKKLKRVLQIGMFLSLSVVLQIIENFVIIPIFIPGVKLGLANIVTLISLYIFGFKDTLKLGILRVVFAALIKNGFGINFLFSFFGVLLSILASSFFKKYSKISVVGVSIVSANFHTLAQVIVATFIYKTNLFFVTYLPYMLLATIVTGAIIGYFGKEVLEKVEF